MANTIFTVYLRKIVKILIPKIWHVFLNDFTCAASEEFSTSFASSRFPAFPVIFKSSFSIKKISCLYLQKVIASCLSIERSRDGRLFSTNRLDFDHFKIFCWFSCHWHILSMLFSKKWLTPLFCIEKIRLFPPSYRICPYKHAMKYHRKVGINELEYFMVFTAGKFYDT